MDFDQIKVGDKFYYFKTSQKKVSTSPQFQGSVGIVAKKELDYISVVVPSNTNPKHTATDIFHLDEWGMGKRMSKIAFVCRECGNYECLTL